jgi:hypothetical protein
MSKNIRKAHTTRLLIGVLALGAALWGIRFYLDTQRTEALRRWATENGFQFVDSPDAPVFEGVPNMHLLRLGRSRNFKNLSAGMAGGLQFRIFDYAFSCGRRCGNSQTVALFHEPIRNRIEFEVRPRNVSSSKLNSPPEGGGIYIADFESNWLFSNRYLLRGTEDAALIQTIRTFVTGSGKQTQWWVEGRGEWLLLCHYDGKVGPGEMDEFVRQATAFAQALQAVEHQN